MAFKNPTQRLIEKYENHEPVFDTEVIQAADSLLGQAVAELRTSISPLTAEMLSTMMRIHTSEIDTLAVTTLPSGQVALLINAQWCLASRTTNDLAFVVCHEINHVLLEHLKNGQQVRDQLVRAKQTNDQAKLDKLSRISLGLQIAEEAQVNTQVAQIFTKDPSIRASKWKLPSFAAHPEAVLEEGCATKTDWLDRHAQRASDDSFFKESGVHPWKVYTDAKKKAKKAGIPEITFELFVQDLRAAAEWLGGMEMKDLEKLAEQLGSTGCEHGSGDQSSSSSGSGSSDSNSGSSSSSSSSSSGGGQDGEDEEKSNSGGGSGKADEKAGTDHDSISDLVEKSLENVVSEAINARERGQTDSPALQEMEQMLENLPEGSELSKIAGRVGANHLRAQLGEAKKVQFLGPFLESFEDRVTPGQALSIKEGSMGFFDKAQFTRRGDEREQYILVAVDTSGSMPSGLLQAISELLGEEEGIRMDVFAFDTSAALVAPDDEGNRSMDEGVYALVGGGGTSFECINQLVNESEDEYDAIVMITDGYAPAIYPEEPERWLWMLTNDRDTAENPEKYYGGFDPSEENMECFHVPDDEISELAGRYAW